MGRPRKPIEQHLLDGTYRADRHGPLPGKGVVAGEWPSTTVVKLGDLTGRAGELWAEYVRFLAGRINQGDWATLADLCRWVARGETIATQLDAVEPTSKEFRSLIVSAAIATDKVINLGARFGLTPADRAKGRVGAAVVADGVAKPKVRQRPATALDRAGPPVE